MKSLWLTLLLLISPLALGQNWNDATLSLSRQWNLDNATFSDPFSATAWGSIKRDGASISDDEQRDTTVYLQTDYYSKKQVAYLKTQKQGTSPFTRNAPLMVILPGIFGGALGANELSVAQKFYRSGYHMLILSSPWDREMIKRNPRFTPGDIVQEGQSVLAAINRAVQHEVNPKYVSSISLYGESYGAFLAAIASGLDDPANPLITGKVMMVGPPLNMLDALQNLDYLYDDTRDIQNYCHSQRIRIGLNFMRAHSQGSLSENSLMCAKALVGVSFNGRLGQAITEIYHSTTLSLPSDPYSVRFGYYIEHFVPDQNIMCHTTERCTLAYWIKTGVANHKRDYAVIASEDDFLNVEAKWEKVSESLTDPTSQLILLKWGGHLGYLGEHDLADSFYTN